MVTKDQHVLIFKIRNSVVSTSSAVNELGTYCKRRDPLERKSNERTLTTQSKVQQKPILSLQKLWAPIILFQVPREDTNIVASPANKMIFCCVVDAALTQETMLGRIS